MVAALIQKPVPCDASSVEVCVNPEQTQAPKQQHQQGEEDQHEEQQAVPFELFAKEWYRVDVDVRFNEDAMLLGNQSISAAWRLFLFGNGSPTHHLGLLTGSPTEVDVLACHGIDDLDIAGTPIGIDQIQTPRWRRQVYLRNSRGERLGYATSWMNESDVGVVFKNQRMPIGKNIWINKTELFRDMKSVFRGHSKQLEQEFGHSGPFWGRSYLFWRGGRPVTLIYEVFSPELVKYMGPVLLEGNNGVTASAASEQ